jgi:SAM-dependent methyltransferase
MVGNGLEYDEIAEGIFAPIFPLIARQIIAKTGCTEGDCLDVGSGGGHLGLSLAKITNLRVVLLDVLPEALAIAEKRITEWGLSSRATTLLGDVHQIPAGDNAFDLAISRGSLWFWKDQKKALEEIYRVLKPGGAAYIGGGFGSAELKHRCDEKMAQQGRAYPDFKKLGTGWHDPDRFATFLTELGIAHFEIDNGDKGFWIVVYKPERPNGPSTQVTARPIVGNGREGGRVDADTMPKIASGA